MILYKQQRMQIFTHTKEVIVCSVSSQTKFGFSIKIILSHAPYSQVL